MSEPTVVYVCPIHGHYELMGANRCPRVCNIKGRKFTEQPSAVAPWAMEAVFEVTRRYVPALTHEELARLIAQAIPPEVARALEFYADEHRWRLRDNIMDECVPEDTVYRSRGAQAAAALKLLRGN